MIRIALLRHPRPLIAAGICYGATDIALAPGALRTMAAVLDALRAARFARVWTSPRRRCRVVAQAIAPHPLVDARLAELDFGAWEGRRWDAIPRRDLDRWAAAPDRFAPPGGETGAALVARVRAVHADLLAAACDTVVVSHGGPLKLLAALLAGAEPDLLAPVPALGSCQLVEIASSAAHSPSTEAAPSTSPV